MLKIQNLLPSIYYEESRDFQVFGRSFEVVYNYLKTNVDLVNENPVDARSSELLINLVTRTLGFESKHEYDIDDLRMLCCVFMRCLRKKGTKSAIEDAIQGLLNVQRISSGFSVDIIHENNDVLLNISLPAELRDVVLLEDLFDYILPAGILYNCVYGNYGIINNADTNITSVDTVRWRQYQDNNLGTVVDGTNIPERTDYENIIDETKLTKLTQTFTGTVASPEPDDNEGE